MCLDLQDCALQSFRPQMHHPRNRKRGRATSPLPGRLVAGPQSQIQDGSNAIEPSQGADWTRFLSKRYHERMTVMISLRGRAYDVAIGAMCYIQDGYKTGVLLLCVCGSVYDLERWKLSVGFARAGARVAHHG